MKVGELKKKLSIYNDEMEVVVLGYEAGYEPVADCVPVLVAYEDQEPGGVYGPHTNLEAIGYRFVKEAKQVLVKQVLVIADSATGNSRDAGS